MKESLFFIVCTLSIVSLFSDHGVIKDFVHRTKTLSMQESQIDKLKVQLLHEKRKINKLNGEVAIAQAKLEHLRNKSSRSIASTDENDLVQFDVYQWSPEQLLELADQSLYFEKYEKASQFYQTLITKFEKNKIVTANVYFNAGRAAFNSKNHYDWAIAHFSTVLNDHSTNLISRQARLWLALTYHRMGDSGRFIASVNDFRLKYRNTKEWQVLSRYYETLAAKYKVKDKK